MWPRLSNQPEPSLILVKLAVFVALGTGRGKSAVMFPIYTPSHTEGGAGIGRDKRDKR